MVVIPGGASNGSPCSTNFHEHAATDACNITLALVSERRSDSGAMDIHGACINHNNGSGHTRIKPSASARRSNRCAFLSIFLRSRSH